MENTQGIIGYEDLVIDKISPKVGLKEAFQAKYINNIEPWLEIIDDRNLLSQTYDFEFFEKIIADIQLKYTPLSTAIYLTLKATQL